MSPLYEFHCPDCCLTWEELQPFSAPNRIDCPACDGEAKRTVTAPAVIHISGHQEGRIRE